MATLPKRDVPTLIKVLRIRALALTGERWEREATRDMMKEAAQQLENFDALFKPDVAYMPVPRCDSCKHWTKYRGEQRGLCNKITTTTVGDFGCVRWETKDAKQVG